VEELGGIIMMLKLIFFGGLARERPIHYYVAIPISCDMSLKTVAGLSVQYGLRLIELYLNSRPKWVHSSSTMKYTQIPTYTQMGTQASQSIGSSRTISGVVNSTLIPEIMEREVPSMHGCAYVNNDQAS